MGTVGNIVQSLKLPDGNVKVLVEGLDRARALEWKEDKGFFRVVVKILPKLKETSRRRRGCHEPGDRRSSSSTSSCRTTCTTTRCSPRCAWRTRASSPTPSPRTCSSRWTRSRTSSRSSPRRSGSTASPGILEAEVDKLQVDRRIQGRVKKQMEQAQKEYYLNEKMKAIQKELGRKDEKGNETDELQKKIEQARMPKEAEEKALQELKRLEAMPPMSAEATVSRNYLDWLIAVPWHKKTKESRDLKPAEQILNEDHYGLEKVKERIVEFLAVRAAGQEAQGDRSCASSGPPGVGQDLARQVDRARRRTASSCGSRWAACATRPRSAATAAPTSGPSPARSSR